MNDLAERLSDDAAPPVVYTVCDESRYLIVKNVPALGCIEELVNLFGSYGSIEEYRLMDEEDSEPYTDIYWIKYQKISNARFAKRKLDNFNFLGNVLQVTYAPIYETLLDTKEKLEERRSVVLSRLRLPKQETKQQISTSQFITTGSLQVARKTNHVKEIEENLQRGQQVVVEKHQYFPSVSMNAAVHTVRQKLNQISSIGASCGLSSPSKQKLEADQHSQSDMGPPQKKPRTDNRRRI